MLFLIPGYLCDSQRYFQEVDEMVDKEMRSIKKYLPGYSQKTDIIYYMENEYLLISKSYILVHTVPSLAMKFDLSLVARNEPASSGKRVISRIITFNIAISNKCCVLCFRPLLKQIKNSAESHIVLDCTTERIYDVLKQAQQIGMMSDYHSYLITSLVRQPLLLYYSSSKTTIPDVSKQD